MIRFPFLVREFNPVVEDLRGRRTSFTEDDALHTRFWSVGDDAALREDLRFRSSYGDRWILAEHLLINDIAHLELVAQGGGELTLGDCFPRWDARYEAHTVLCPADERLVVTRDVVRLHSSQLGDRPRLVDASPLERWVTHLPFYSLRAVAASMPSGGWDARALDAQVPQLLGWIEVRAPLSKDRRLFVARIDGRSMDDGRNGLRDGALAVFRAGAVDLDARPIAVVRGAFRDPDAAGYVLKRIVRDLDGVRLVSANPDRSRYPDIALDPSRAAELAVVAELVAPLPADDYARAPRAPRAVGQRPLESRDYQAQVQEGLENKLDRVFGPPSAAPDAPPEDAWASWSSALCLDGELLAVRLSALPGLPEEVRVVSVAGAPATSAVLAANARLHPRFIRVPIQGARYVPVADGIVGPAAEALAALSLPGLDEGRATVFAPRTQDRWLRRETPRIRPGEVVRVLVPPSLATASIGERTVIPMGGGWTLVEWATAAVIIAEERARLEALGISVGLDPLRARFAGSAPRRIEVTPRGDEVPVWRPGDAVAVTVVRAGDGAPREAALFAFGPRGMASIALGESTPWTVALSELVPGRYAICVVARETSVDTDDLFFEVREGVEGAWPAASVSLQGIDPAKSYDLSTTLAQLPIAAPPFWEVSARWEEGSSLRLDVLRASEIGAVDVSPWRAVLAPRLATARRGRLAVTAGPLGAWTLQHRRVPTAEAVRDALREMWEELGAAVEGSAALPAMLFDPWLRPALMHLGWSVPPSWNPSLAGEGVAAVGIRSTRGLRAVLVAAPATRWGEGALGELAHRFSGDGAHDLLLSDGVRWRRYDARREQWSLEYSITESLATAREWEHFHTTFDER